MRRPVGVIVLVWVLAVALATPAAAAEDDPTVGDLTVLVTSADGTPMRERRVEVLNAARGASVRGYTTVEGTVRWPTIWSGDSEVVVHDGYAEQRFPVRVATGTRLTARLAATHAIGGRVILQGTRSPMAGITVLVSGTDGTSVFTTTDSRGTWQAAMRHGGTAITVTEPFYDKWVPYEGPKADASRTIAAVAHDLLDVDVVMPRLGAVSATVRPARAYGLILERDGVAGWRAGERPDGSRLDAVAPVGPYLGYTYGTAESPSLVTYVGDTVRRVDARPVVVREHTTTEVSITAVPAAVVTGTVIGADGKPAKGALVWIEQLDRYGYTRVQTSSDGRFALGGIASGPVRVWIGHERSAARREVTVRQGSTTNLGAIRLSRSGTVKGRIDTGGRGGVWSFSLVRADGTLADGDGTWSVVREHEQFALRGTPPGTYRFVLHGSNYSRKVTVRPGHTVDIGAVRVGRRFRVEGTVRTSQGPVARALVIVRDARGTELRRTRTDARGRYSVGGVRRGTYTVTAELGGARSALGRRTFTAKGHDQRLPAIVLREPGALKGTVRDPSGRPVAGVVVAVGGRSATTSRTGRFSLGPVRSGSAQVVVEDPYVGGFLTKRFTVAVRPGQVATADVRLRR